MDNNMKRIFMRFLKEKKIYYGLINKMKNNSWKNLCKIYFDIVEPQHYLDRSFTFDHRDNFTYELIECDFEWKIICSKIDKKYEKHLINFIKSPYFNSFYIRNRELLNEYQKKYKNIIGKEINMDF